MSAQPPVLALTTGEPAGIGPDLAVTLARRQRDQRIVAVGDTTCLRQRAEALGIEIDWQTFDADGPGTLAAGAMEVVDVPADAPVTPGQLDSANALYVLKTLRVAAEGCDTGRFDAMVTAPVNKGVINQAGVPFSGHTEYLAWLTGAFLPVMMLTAGTLRVALVTTHLPLRDVADAITRDRLAQVVRVLDRDLRDRFGLDNPRILVAGLNPHAGEDGHLGREEIDTIEPTLERLRGEGINVVGPLPADTLYTPRQLDGAAATLAMFHDQGLPVLKYAGFGQAVNVTLGLPIIRTSVDHGTALELAGTGRAEGGSLLAAIDQAAELVQSARHTGG